MDDNLTFDKLEAVIKALGPKPETYEVWALEYFSRFGEDGNPMIIKATASGLDTVWKSVSGDDFVIMVNPLTWSDIVIGSFHSNGEAITVPVFNDDDLREHWKNIVHIPAKTPMFWNERKGGDSIQ